MSRAEQGTPPPLLLSSEGETCSMAHGNGAVAGTLRWAHSDTSNITDGAHTPMLEGRPCYSIGSSTANMTQRHVGLGSRILPRGRRSPVSSGDMPLQAGVVSTYDPLSTSRHGRVRHNEGIAQAMVNALKQIQRMGHPCRQSLRSTALADGAKLGCHQHLSSRSSSTNNNNNGGGGGGNNHSGSHRMAGSSTVVSSSTPPRTLPANPQKPAFSQDTFKLSGVGPDKLLLASPVRCVGGANNDMSCSDASCFLVKPPESLSRERLKLDSRAVNRRCTLDPMAWHPEFDLVGLRPGSGTLPHGASGRRLECKTPGWRGGNICPAPPGQTMDHKQLTEAFYRNGTGDILAQEAYLHFMKKMNRRRGKGRGVFS